jgi:hypothetical protein
VEVLEIRGLWKKIRIKWDTFWIGDENDDSKKHLSQSDKRSLLYGYFVIGTLTVVFVVFLIKMNDIRINRRNDEAMEELLNMVISYVEAATEDEYDEIAQTIRHDLVFHKYEKDIEKYIRYIPNTSEQCRACRGIYPAQAVLVSLNTGESYSLDLFEQGIEPEEYQGNTLLTYGYDEISQTSIHISKSPGENKGLAEIERGNGIVSIHRMKRLFCDDCIRAMLDTVEHQLIGELVICDTKKNTFYPLEDESKAQIGDYALETEYKDGDYEIAVKSVNETE